MPDGLRLALTTLTVLPVRGPAVVDRRTAGAAMAYAPLVGLLIGFGAALVLRGLRALSPGDLLPAALTVATLALLTRGLHLDGLADTADGLASALPAERARQVMKSPEVGALGAVTVVLALGVQVVALAQSAGQHRGTLAVLTAAVASRLAVTVACTPGTPAAAPTGLGALVSGTVRPTVAATLAAASALVLGPLAVLDGDVAPGHVLLAGGAGLLAARVLRRHAVRRLGGITGDVLGALVEVTTTVVLVVMALQLPS